MKPKVMCRGLGLGLPALVCAIAVAPAQTPEGEMVPRELVETLSVGLPVGRRALPDVLVGRLPESTARMVSLPSGSRVVGSLVYPRYSMSAVAVPGTPAEVRDDWIARLLAAGWRRFELPLHGGFESNPIESLQFCMGDSVTLNLGVSANPRGGSYVLLTHLTSRRSSICRSRERPLERQAFRNRESLIPSLTPPTGSASLGGGSGGGSDEWEAQARIGTVLTVEQLIEHYGSQLKSHGWVPLERTAAHGIAVETYRVTDPEGAAWHGVLTATAPLADADRFLSLRVTRVERGY